MLNKPKQRRCSHCKNIMNADEIVCPYCGKESRLPFYKSGGFKVIVVCALLGFGMFLSTNPTLPTFEFNFHFPTFDFLFPAYEADDSDANNTPSDLDTAFDQLEFSFEDVIDLYMARVQDISTSEEYDDLIIQVGEELDKTYEEYMNQIESMFDENDQEYDDSISLLESALEDAVNTILEVDKDINF